MNRLCVVGAGGHGRVVAEAAESTGRWDSICFLDDRFPELTRASDWPVVGRTEHLANLAVGQNDAFIVAIGNAEARLEVIERLARAGLQVTTVIHPSAVVSRRTTIAEGTVVCANACVSIGAMLGRGVIVNTAATVDHDCELGEGVHICPGANLAGNVMVGRRSWIGVGACVRQGILIGEDVVVGAGAAVVSNIPDSALALGVPARARARP